MENKLKELIAENYSTNQIADRLGISQTTVMVRLKKYKLKTNHKVKHTKVPQIRYCLACEKQLPTCCYNKVCNTKCDHDYKYIKYITQWKAGLVDGMCGKYGISGHIRRYLIEKYGNQCVECGWNKVNTVTKKVPVHIDHIDGNYRNNKEENLKLICPNCHSLTSTYGALNIKSGLGRHKQYI